MDSPASLKQTVLNSSRTQPASTTRISLQSEIRRAMPPAHQSAESRTENLRSHQLWHRHKCQSGLASSIQAHNQLQCDGCAMTCRLITRAALTLTAHQCVPRSKWQSSVGLSCRLSNCPGGLPKGVRPWRANAVWILCSVLHSVLPFRRSFCGFI